MAAFTIDRVDWHTEAPAEPESLEVTRRRFFYLIRFLREHQLLAVELPELETEIESSFTLKSDHVTSTGLELLRSACARWTDHAELTRRPEDTSVLEAALAEIRSRS